MSPYELALKNLLEAVDGMVAAAKMVHTPMHFAELLVVARAENRLSFAVQELRQLVPVANLSPAATPFDVSAIRRAPEIAEKIKDNFGQLSADDWRVLRSIIVGVGTLVTVVNTVLAISTAAPRVAETEPIIRPL